MRVVVTKKRLSVNDYERFPYVAKVYVGNSGAYLQIAGATPGDAARKAINAIALKPENVIVEIQEGSNG